MDVSTIIAAMIGGVVGWHLGDIVFGVKGKGSVKGAPKRIKQKKARMRHRTFTRASQTGCSEQGIRTKATRKTGNSRLQTQNWR